ncbi:MAG TPA: CHAD domain-containing protein [Caulobacteraceae bacterium]|nr:CHAD domain-containing protein [Caulobacteraceae bacterium]
MGDFAKVGAKPAQEVELKFELEPEALDRLEERLTVRAADLSPAQTVVSVYYDTPSQALRKAGLTLRVRTDGGRSIQTVKTVGDGLFTRGEWECDLVQDGLNLDALSQTPFAETFGDAAPLLKPIFSTRMRRTRRLIREPAGEVEAALDRGDIEAAGRTIAVCELELELKSGLPEALFGLARRLSESEPLRLSFETKAARGFRLLSAVSPGPNNGEPPRLNPDMTVAQAFAAIGARGLRQLTANAQTLRALRRPEALHQARVAIRRLRTAFKLFEAAARDNDYDRLAGELKWLGREMDEARDLDVMIADTFRPAADRLHDQKGLAELGRRMHAARGAAYDRALKALDSPRYLTLTLDLAAWLDSGAWRAPDGRASGAIGPFARQGLDRLRRQIKRQGKGLEGLSPDLRHKLRIRAKRLRYAVEFFGDLYDGAHGRKAFTQTLKGLQDALGSLNDLEVARRHGLALAESGGRAAGDSATQGARQAFAAGLMIGARAKSEKPMLKTAGKLLDKLVAAEPFWRG